MNSEQDEFKRRKLNEAPSEFEGEWLLNSVEGEFGERRLQGEVNSVEWQVNSEKGELNAVTGGFVYIAFIYMYIYIYIQIERERDLVPTQAPTTHSPFDV